MRPRRETLVHVPAAIAAVGAVLLVFQWAGARPLWLDEEFLAVSLRDRGITDYVKPLWLGQTAPFGWLTLLRDISQGRSDAPEIDHSMLGSSS